MRPVVLSVEDDDAAFHLLEIAFEEIHFQPELHRTVNGQEALDFLHRSVQDSDGRRPDLVLLNLNLPKVNGVEVLAAIQTNRLLAPIPVIVFTSSNLDEDRARCLALGARDFVTKPTTYDGFVHAVSGMCAMLPA
jgi:CheY-like chemotaxis protein